MPLEITNELEGFKKVIEQQKGLFTVLITLGTYKLLNPLQDIRNHQASMSNGFAGRHIDEVYITPTLKELGLPSMSESGWLTRSIEQPHPFNKQFPGKIKKGKENWLNIIDFIEHQPKHIEGILISILKELEHIKKKNTVVLKPLKNPEKISHSKIIKSMKELFNKNYSSSGGSKLPVIALYACLQLLCDEVKRYEKCDLKKLGSHLSADIRSKASGDIEIFKEKSLFESYEVKLDVEINNHIINRVKEKIFKHNPKRYFVLSSKFCKKEKDLILKNIKEVKENHGCQIILSDPITVLENYLLLVDKPESFLELFGKNIEQDTELKVEHKKFWEQLHNTL